MEWELTEAQKPTALFLSIYIYTQTSKKLLPSLSYVNFEKKFPKRDFPYLWEYNIIISLPGRNLPQGVLILGNPTAVGFLVVLVFRISILLVLWIYAFSELLWISVFWFFQKFLKL